MQDLVKFEQFLLFAFNQSGHRDTRPTRDNPGNFILGDLLAQQPRSIFRPGQLAFGLSQLAFELRQTPMFEFGGPVQIVFAFGNLNLLAHLFDFLAQNLDGLDLFLLRVPLGSEGFRSIAQIGEFLAQVFQTGLARLVLLLFQGGFLYFQLHDPTRHFVEFRRQRIDFRPDHGAGFVNQVNRLVRQEPIGNVTMAQGRGGHQRVILDADTMMHFKTFFQAAQDTDRVFDGGLFDHDRLKAPFQGGIFFNILAVLIDGRRTDTVQLATCKHRLEHVARIDGALCLAGTDNGMQLIDKEQDPAITLPDLRQNGLEALLEFTTVLGTGQQRAHIQSKDRFVLEPFRDISAHDTLGKPFDNRRLADPRFTDQDRVVLGLPRQDANHAPDFTIPADHRVKLALLHFLDQVPTVLFQSFIGPLRIRAGYPLMTAHIAEHLQQAVTGQVELQQNPSRRRLLALICQHQEQVLDADIFVFQVLGFLLSLDQQLVEPLGDINLAGFNTRPGYRGDFL